MHGCIKLTIIDLVANFQRVILSIHEDMSIVPGRKWELKLKPHLPFTVLKAPAYSSRLLPYKMVPQTNKVLGVVVLLMTIATFLNLSSTHNSTFVQPSSNMLPCLSEQAITPLPSPLCPPTPPAPLCPPTQQVVAVARSDNEEELINLRNQLAQVEQKLSAQLSAPATNLASGAKVIGRSLQGDTSQAALKHVLANGWENSDVYITNNQHYRNDVCFYQGNCNLHGENVLGRCFCLPGWTGVECETQDLAVLPCSNRDDKCFYTEEGGVFAISLSRWHMAQEAELAMWNGKAGKKAGAAGTGDRIDEHLKDFDNYVSVGAQGKNLGNFIEVGTGPWTQSLSMLKARGFTVDKYVIMEPGAINYAANTPGTVYRDGQIDGFDGKTVVINAGGEHLDLFYESFDTVMIVNVLEHVNNGPHILRNLYNSLKPGGLLIFQDRWWDSEGAPGTVRADLDMDVLFHPVRMKQVIFDQFLSGFDKVYERRNEEVVSFHTAGRNYEGTYFIGRKKNSQC
jgi:SAM-dependent methyltransferase